MLLMTCFEIIFMFTAVIPAVKQKLDNMLEQIADSISARSCQYINNINNINTMGVTATMANTYSESGWQHMNSILTALAHSETVRKQKNNQYVKSGACLIIVILSILATSLAQKIDADTVTSSLFRAAVTVSILIPLQCNFYLFSQKYKYESSAVMKRKIRNSLKHCKGIHEK